jgi:hypothetical protein
MAAEDNSCTHVLFAACHDTSYLSSMVPYSGMRDKITLVQGAGFNSEFYQFNLSITQFPTVFRWSELHSTSASTKPATANSSTPSKKPNPKASTHDTENLWPPAWGAEEQSPASYIDSTESAPRNLKEGTVPCRYFQKVLFPTMRYSLHRLTTPRVFAALATNAPSSTSQNPRQRPCLTDPTAPTFPLSSLAPAFPA